MTKQKSDQLNTPAPPKAVSGYRTFNRIIVSRATLMAARRYSIFVRFMKGALPAAAIALGLAVVLYALRPRETAQMAFTFASLGRIEGDLSMVRPQLTGVDNDGRPFVVTAATAVQTSPGSDSLQLNQVSAEIDMKDGSQLHVTAARGLFNTKSHLLDASGGIHFVSNDGYDAKAASAIADLKTGTMSGEQSIEASGKFGHITAQRFALDQTKQQVHFSGNVHMLLHGVQTKK